jgi:hypothetical protein
MLFYGHGWVGRFPVQPITYSKKHETKSQHGAFYDLVISACHTKNENDAPQAAKENKEIVKDPLPYNRIVLATQFLNKQNAQLCQRNFTKNGNTC